MSGYKKSQEGRHGLAGRVQYHHHTTKQETRRKTIWTIWSPWKGRTHSVLSQTPCYMEKDPSHWWASSSDTLIYPSVFAFPLLSLHRQSTTMHLHSNVTAQQLHSLHQTDLAYLMDTWFTIHMYLLLFLASPMCPLLWSDQSQALTLHSLALSITLPYARFLVFHSYLTCLYLPFALQRDQRPLSEKSPQLPIPVSPRIEI